MNTTVEYALVNEFKKALKERISNEDISFMYQKFFFGFFISEEELGKTLKYYQEVFQKEPDDWFRQFHKSIRQTDFFDGDYYKEVNILTEEETKRRKELMNNWSSIKYTPADVDELRKLHNKFRHPEKVSVGGVADALLYSLIHVDETAELKHAMEIAFKICS